MSFRTIVAVLGLVVVTSPLAAQQLPAWDPKQPQLTRGELELLLDQLEKIERSSAYSDVMRGRARARTEMIRSRLQRGDFQVGDRVALRVENETTLSDSFTVSPDRTLRLPLVGEVSLAGVLRSELESHLRGEIGRFIRDPQLEAQSLIRVFVDGGAGRPGFYAVPSEVLFTDLVTAAGGFSTGAKTELMYVTRGDTNVISSRTLVLAMEEGATLDQLSMRSGDRLVVPTVGTGLGGAESKLRSIGILLSLPFAVLGLIQLVGL